MLSVSVFIALTTLVCPPKPAVTKSSPLPTIWHKGHDILQHTPSPRQVVLFSEIPIEASSSIFRYPIQSLFPLPVPSTLYIDHRLCLGPLMLLQIGKIGKLTGTTESTTEPLSSSRRSPTTPSILFSRQFLPPIDRHEPFLDQLLPIVADALPALTVLVPFATSEFPATFRQHAITNG